MKEGWIDLDFWKSDKWTEVQNYLKQHPDFVPTPEKIFRALEYTPLDRVKAVIIGQDPYPAIGMATGLAFSIGPAVSREHFPGSLQNIFKEYCSDLGFPVPRNGSLVPWAQQGVLLLNTLLTTTTGQRNAHHDIGWETLTTEILQTISEYNPTAVFVIWGKEASILIHNTACLRPKFFVRSSHPSPLSAHKGFLGSRPFTRVNSLLSLNRVPPINWRLP